MRCFLASTFVLCLSVSLFGADKQAETKPAKTGAEITRLVDQLGDARWKVREKTSSELREIGSPVLTELEKALKSTDAEVRFRASRLLVLIRRDVVMAHMGHTLIADSYGYRVVEIDKYGKKIWSLEELEIPVVAQRLSGGRTLVAERAGGRVTVFDRDKKAVWKIEGLGHVWHASRLANGNTLITSCGEELFSKGKVIEVDKDQKIVWKIENLEAPRSSQRLPNGNTLIVERKTNRVIEVDKDKKIVWKKESLQAPLHALRLPGGNTLIAEWDPARVLEVDSKGKTVWEFSEGLEGTGDVHRLKSGHTLITDFATDRIMQVDSKGNVVWDYPGLTRPCSAVRLGEDESIRPKLREPLKEPGE